MRAEEEDTSLDADPSQYDTSADGDPEVQVCDLSVEDLDDIHDYYSDGRDYWSDFQLESVEITDEAVAAATGEATDQE